MPKTILIVDDSEINRMMLSKILCDEYAIEEAENGDEAVRMLTKKYQLLSAVLLDIMMPIMDGYQVLEKIQSNPVLSQIPVVVITASTDPESEGKALSLGATDFITKPFDAKTVKQRLRNLIRLRETSAIVNSFRRDKLTGLWNRETFYEKVAWSVAGHPAGHYVLASVDIDNFKVINDQYGSEKGDEVLKSLAKRLQRCCEISGGICGRISADNFISLYDRKLMDSGDVSPDILESGVHEDTGMSVALSVGRYIIADKTLSVGAMYDRAKIAQANIKGRYDVHVAVYDEAMRSHILREQEIVSEMNYALENGQFEAWFQPQYNHSTGALVGAEALARWRHPTRGLISPNEFVPVFERNGFVYQLDKFMWERVCEYLQKWLSQGRVPLPVSVNISRYDLFRDDLVDVISALVKKYGVPERLLRLEITESAFAGSTLRVVDVTKQLIDKGFTVEIDDFGSGYSSLNTLKDVPAQVVKLDMRFLESSDDSGRGGNILESVVRMSKWLGMSVIAEGVEEPEQADFLKSIGCNYIQGYLYARPMPAEDYERLERLSERESKLVSMETAKALENNAFWDPKSMDTLIFNNYVGPACIFEWHDQKIEMLRANDKFAKTIGGDNCTVDEALRLVWEEHMDKQAAARTVAAIEKAVKTGDDVTYEAAYDGLLASSEKTYLKTTLRLIAKTIDRSLIYATNENITQQKRNEEKLKELSVSNAVPYILSAIMKNSTDLTFAKDKDFNYVCCSPAFVKFTRQNSEADVIGRNDYDFWTKEEADHFRRDDQLLFESGEPLIGYIEPIPSDDGIQHYCSTSKYILKDAAGEIIGMYGIGRDITEERTAYEQLKLLTDSIPGGIATYAVSPERTKITYFNDGFCKMLGYTREEYQEISATGITNITFSEDVPIVNSQIKALIRDGTPLECTYRIHAKGGGYKWVNLRGDIAERLGDTCIVNAVLYDITAQKNAEEALRAAGELTRSRLMAALSTIYPVIISVNLSQNQYQVVANNGFMTMLNAGQGAIDQLILAASRSLEPEYVEKFNKLLKVKSIARHFPEVGSSLRMEYRQKVNKDDVRWVETTIIRTENEYNDDITGVVVSRYVDDQKDMEDKLKEAENDGMTGIYNKTVTERLIADRLAQESGRPCAMLIADLDNLKAINDSLGHDVGDVAIKQMSELLHAQFRQTDVVGRVGGDEFAVFVSDVSKDRIIHIMTSFMKKLSNVRIGSRGAVSLHGSVGIAMGETGRYSFEELFKRADTALYHVKRNGKGSFAFYSEVMEAEAAAAAASFAALRK